MNRQRQGEIEFEAKHLSKKLLYYDAVIDFLKMFGLNEIGTEVEIDILEVSKYLCSGKFVVDSQLATEKFNKEVVYKMIESEILDGMPVWDFFIMSDWKKEIMRKSYEKDVKDTTEYMQQKYKCVTCKYFKITDTEFGLFYDCSKQIHSGIMNRTKSLWERPKVFDLQEKCIYWEDRKVK